MAKNQEQLSAEAEAVKAAEAEAVKAAEAEAVKAAEAEGLFVNEKQSITSRKGILAPGQKVLDGALSDESIKQLLGAGILIKK